MIDVTRDSAAWIATGVETIGVTVTGVFAVYAVGLGIVTLVRGRSGDRAFHEVRYRLARGILIGLCFWWRGHHPHGSPRVALRSARGYNPSPLRGGAGQGGAGGVALG
jgi:hypothetical protein